MIIVTDSACDMPPQEAQNLGIHIAPLFIQFPEGGVSSETISADEFYRRLKTIEPDIPTTSQPSAGMFAELYRGLSADQEEILSIHISSGLSGTIESARLGAQQAPEAHVTHFDTLTLSGAQRFQVLAAAQAARLGWGKADILKRLEQIRAASEIAYTLETLKYLARGGRIGRVQALAGSLLKIKPVIKVEKTDGKYSTVGKERTLLRSMEAIRDYLAGVFHDQPVWVSVMHGQLPDPANTLSGLLEQKLNVARLEVLRISPVLGVHTGPGVVGAAAVPYALVEDLG